MGGEISGLVGALQNLDTSLDDMATISDKLTGYQVNSSELSDQSTLLKEMIKKAESMRDDTDNSVE